MKIAVVYCFPTHGAYFENAVRFVSTYNLYPAGVEHELIIVSNGGKPTGDMSCLIAAVAQEPKIHVHDNTGYDIGAFQSVAACNPCDMMVFFGSSAYLRGANWLRRMAKAFESRGRSDLYGCTANCGDARCGVSPHIRTTGFWCAPIFMNMYPFRVKSPEQRYPFEHGQACFTTWMKTQGHRAFMVTWDQESEWPAWDSVPNGFHRGDQSGIIAGDRLTAPPFYPHA